METTMGNLIDSRGLDLFLDEGDFVTDIVVVAEVMTEDGRKRLAVVADEHTNWLKEMGMLTAAQKQVVDAL